MSRARDKDGRRCFQQKGNFSSPNHVILLNTEKYLSWITEKDCTVQNWGLCYLRAQNTLYSAAAGRILFTNIAMIIRGL